MQQPILRRRQKLTIGFLALAFLVVLSIFIAGYIVVFVIPHRYLVVMVDGVDISQHSDGFRGQHIGVLSFNTYLYDEMTVMENLRFYGDLYQIKNPKDRIEELLNTVGMESRSGSPVGTLSQGMRPVSYTHLTLPTNREV